MLSRIEAIDLIARLHVQCVILSGVGEFHGGISDRIGNLRFYHKLTSREAGEEIMERAKQIQDKIILMLHEPEHFVH